jgi:ribosome-binding protein aMBF1 (putative translation factor)
MTISLEIFFEFVSGSRYDGLVGDRSGLRTRAEREKDSEAEAFTLAVGDAVRQARQKRGWTQVELAEKAGLSGNYVARLERGEVGPSLFVAQRLCEALDTDLDSLTAPKTARTTKRRVAR